METVTSKDGTTIAFERSGNGPALILVGGALEHRAMDSETAQLARFPTLSQHFTVYHYDRRGRGDSTDTQPFAVDREVEDIEALIDAAGGTAFLSGISSGAALAFEATLALGDKVQKLVMYEPPYNDDDEARQAWSAYREHVTEASAAGRGGDAVGLFMSLLGVSPEDLEVMRQYPMWPQWESVGITLAYDAAALGEDAAVPIERAAHLAIPVLLIVGEHTYPFMHAAAEALAQAIPQGETRQLAGQTHEVAADAIAPVLVEFFAPEAG